MPSIPTCKRNLDKASREYAAALEELARLALLKLAATHPEKTVIFCSAMGTWTWYVGDLDVNPPASRAFQTAKDQYGWNVIPAPIRMEVKDGKFTRLTDW
jgi:hypothetical protein